MSLDRSRVSLTGCALALALGGGLCTVDGAEPRGPKVEPKARETLGQVIAAYKALAAYGDRGKFVLDIAVNGTPKAQTVPLHLTLVRPNKISLDTGLTRVVCNGKTLKTAVMPLRKYTSAPAPATITFETVFTDGSLGSSLFGGPAPPMMLILMNLFLGDDPAKAVLDLGDSLATEPDREVDGKPCQVLKIGSETGPSFLLLVDPGSKLLRAIDLTFDPGSLAESFPAGRVVKIDKYRWTSGPISTHPAPEAAFVLALPDGFSRVDALGQKKPKGEGDEPEQKFKVHGFVGKPAPTFNLTVLDGDGKTRTVSKADLAGKVVMIDFWATWCGPCLAELPEVQKLIESYGKAKKDVVIVALSQDNDPKDPAEVRKLIESTLKTKKIVLDGTPVGMVGMDPSNSIGEAFQIEGYPTVVILDAGGVVRSAHVGSSSEIGKVLAKEIDALLDGKVVEKK